MAEHQVRVIEVAGCGSDTVTVKLERPIGYTFTAGQWFRVSVKVADASETRTLSLAAAPADGWLEFTTRLSPSAFKQAVAALAPGDSLEVSDAMGRLRLPSEDRLALLVGGIGVTPVRSMLRDAVGAGRRFADALLVYGNRDTGSECYLEEFLGMAEAGVRVVRVLERPPAEWDGESGFITAETVRRHWSAEDGRPFVITGPPAMIGAMRGVLEELGVGEERVTIESLG